MAEGVGSSIVLCFFDELLQTAALLLSEYICLSVLSFPWSVQLPCNSNHNLAKTHLRSFSVLGIVPGIIITFSVAAMCLYTSIILWRYCLKHPEIRDICDIGQKLFGGSKVAYNITSLFFILNNTFIQGKLWYRLVMRAPNNVPVSPSPLGWSKALEHSIELRKM